MKKAIIIIGLVTIFLTVLIVGGGYAQEPATPSSSLPQAQGGINASGDTINFQGRLYNSAGTSPAAAGDYQMSFAICSDSSCASSVWGPYTHTVTVDQEGLFNVLLGGSGTPSNPLNASHFTGNRYLQIQVCNTVNQNPCTSGWDPMNPPQPITSVAISLGNIRKDITDTSTASSASYILVITNNGTGGAVQGISSGSGVGVYGQSSTGWGVGGYASSVTADVYGVFGYAATTSPYGPPSGDSSGVVGSVASGGDYGVFGISSNSTADTYGVVGAAAGTTFLLPPGGSSAGVVGGVATNGDYGVFGSSYNPYPGPGNQCYGVVGVAATTAVNVPTTGSVGVLGSVSTDTDYGVYGSNSDATDGYGVYGQGYYGVWGESTNASGIGAAGIGGIGIYGETTDTTLWEWAGYFWGDVWVEYDFYADNLYNHALVGGEHRTIYTMASPESWLEDFGSASLVDGQAIVKIDRLFAETVNLDEDYHVFLTPRGDCNGLYVAAATPDYFQVRELGDGKSTITFDYRVVAKRAGYETARMEPIPLQNQPAETAGQLGAAGVKQLTLQERSAQPMPASGNDER